MSIVLEGEIIDGLRNDRSSLSSIKVPLDDKD